MARTDDERQILLRAGLIIERQADAAAPNSPSRERGFYDRFRDRIMFPIRDTRGRTIAFGGRVLDQGEPKYLNSPETELFHKGRELYGLFEARQATRTLQRLLVVEGYMDVVSLHQAGVTYAIATLGTATTPEHLQRIFRLVGEVVFCFDGDRAGRAAAWRALENAMGEIKQGRQVRFLFLPDGHDPDTLVREEGATGFESRLASATPLADYLINELSSRVEMASVDGKARLGRAGTAVDPAYSVGGLPRTAGDPAGRSGPHVRDAVLVELLAADADGTPRRRAAHCGGPEQPAAAAARTDRRPERSNGWRPPPSARSGPGSWQPGPPGRHPAGAFPGSGPGGGRR